MDAITTIYQHFTKSYSITTDSRKVEQGSIFFALKGEHFDGNDFALQVANEGTAACVVADRQELADHPRLIKVDDSLVALQQLARHHRMTTKPIVIGITGTNGKTTSKELITAVLSRRYRTIATQGNYNNHIGVPLTLLRIRPDTEIAIVEMGANHPKEIETLCSIARPDYGAITNIGKAHLEGFGSFEGVVKTKTELYDYLRQHHGTAFVNADNTLLTLHAQGLQQHLYGSDDDSLTKVTFLKAEPFLSIQYQDLYIQTQLVGDYNYENAALATAIGTHFGIEPHEIKMALESYHPENSRSQVIHTDSNTIIMDAYNANPVSMEAAIRNFCRIKKDNELLIIGEMRELGNDSAKEHQNITDLLVAQQCHNVIVVGAAFQATCHVPGWLYFDDVDTLCQHLQNNKPQHTHILIKGSRGMKLEKTLEWL